MDMVGQCPDNAGSSTYTGICMWTLNMFKVWLLEYNLWNMMAVDPSRLRYQQRKLHLKELHRRAKSLLSHRERDSLYASLKEYQAYRQVY